LAVAESTTSLTSHIQPGHIIKPQHAV